MTIRGRWTRLARKALVDPVTVESRHGGGGLGPALEAPVTVRGRVRLERTLARQADGELVDAHLTITVGPVVVDADGNELDALETFTVGTRVTAAGVTGYVLSVATAGVTGVERVLILAG